ncbi:MAG TPA: hypothetical protein VHS31_02550, partial [Tepidisphaeraceae bacterium]|nr:hypothetical protein [Tepidisphaeraceae bacterium]
FEFCAWVLFVIWCFEFGAFYELRVVICELGLPNLFFLLQSRDTDVVGIVHSREWVGRELFYCSGAKRGDVD